jgi:hypothetical protein
MRDTGIEVQVTLGGPDLEGQVAKLEDYMQMMAVGMRVPSGEFVTLTKEDLVRGWAEQTGSSHEDWTMDEALSSVLGSNLRIGGIPGALAELRTTFHTVLMTAKRFLTEYDARMQDQ